MIVALRYPKFLRSLVALGALMAASAVAFANTKGTVRGSEQNGFGRLIFQLESAPRVSVNVTSGVLVVTFDEAVDIDPEKIPNELGAYIGAARRDPDGKSLRFALSRNAKPHLKEAGEKIFLDLLPETWRGLPPGLPQDVVDDLARRAKEAEEALRKAERQRLAQEVRAMPITVSRSSSFTRLVFQMPIVAPVNVKTEAEKIDLAFESAFRIDEARLKAELGALVETINVDTSNATLKLALNFAQGSELSAFREDDSLILDVVSQEHREFKKATRQALESPPQATALPDKPSSPKAQANPVTPEKTATEPEFKPSQTPPRTISDARKAAEQPAIAAQAAPKVTTPIIPTSEKQGETWRLRFPFAQKTPAAAFERAGIVTLVFDTPQPIDVETGLDDLNKAGIGVEGNVIKTARVIRLSMPGSKLVRLAPEGEGWIVTLGDDLAAATEPVIPERTLDEQGRTVVSVPLAGLAGLHWIDDPETGERIAVATVGQPMRSIARPFRFSEFELLPTAHGVAVLALSDDLSVRPGLDDVVIERSGGLAVSPRVASKANTNTPHMLAFERTRWQEEKAGHPRDRIRALQQQAAEAPRGRRTQARTALARTYLALGLHQEARQVAEAIVFDDPDAARDRRIAMLRAVSAAQAGRIPEARKLLDDDLLREDPEATLWRAVLDARQRNWPRAMGGFRAVEDVLDSYPDEWQAMIRMLAARAAIEVRDFGAAANEIEQLEKLDREWLNPQQIAVLRARIDEAQGRTDEALSAYNRVYNGADRPAAAEAGLHGALLSLRDKQMSRADTMARLETVGVIWRGDTVEAEVLGHLGRYYAEDKRWRDAFQVSRRANEVYPDQPVTRALHDEMGRMFETLFLEGHADSIPRVEAVALFYDFKEYLPPGKRGDEIVRRLADRLVELDLLDAASDLLQHQIDYRLTGTERATIATRLGIIQLMNKRPSQAIETLRKSRLVELPQPLKRARSLLEARALSDLSRTDLALDVIATEKGSDVDRLRADIEWQGRRWRAAGETYERILGERWKMREALDDRERSDVIRAATAYALADEPLALDRLRGKFAIKMAASPDARAFTLITSPAPQRAQAFRDLAKMVARADTLMEFLDEYRKRYPDIPPRLMPKREDAKPEAAAKQAAPSPIAEPAKPAEPAKTLEKPAAPQANAAQPGKAS